MGMRTSVALITVILCLPQVAPEDPDVSKILIPDTVDNFSKLGVRACVEPARPMLPRGKQGVTYTPAVNLILLLSFNFPQHFCDNLDHVTLVHY
jgi:hypothetical protein